MNTRYKTFNYDEKRFMTKKKKKNRKFERTRLRVKPYVCVNTSVV